MKGKFYYDRLPKNEKDIYEQMYQAIDRYETEFFVPMCNPVVLHSIYERVILDHPEIFLEKILFEKKEELIKMMPSYPYSKEISLFLSNQVDVKMSPFFTRISGMSPEEKENEIYSYLLQNVTYGQYENPLSHQLTGALLDGKAVCDGICKAFTWMCNKVGIESGIVIGKTKGDQGNKVFDPGLHAWNLVKLGGVWAHVDATYGIGMLTNYSDTEDYDIFNLLSDDDLEMIEYRIPLFEIPRCADV